MQFKIKRNTNARTPVAFIRGGVLYMGCAIGSSNGRQQRNCILGSDGLVRTNGEGDIAKISEWGHDTDGLIYKGDTVEVTF